jgi:hypothetical protein
MWQLQCSEKLGDPFKKSPSSFGVEQIMCLVAKFFPVGIATPLSLFISINSISLQPSPFLAVDFFTETPMELRGKPLDIRKYYPEIGHCRPGHDASKSARANQPQVSIFMHTNISVQLFGCLCFTLNVMDELLKIYTNGLHVTFNDSLGRNLKDGEYIGRLGEQNAIQNQFYNYHPGHNWKA